MNGEVALQETDDPNVKEGYLLIKTLYSAISPGTEKLVIRSSKSTPIDLGYSAMGIVEEVGNGISHFAKGDMVACYGAPYVGHRTKLLVPVTMCARIPESVSYQEAALGGIGAIAIHALRTGKLQFGETIAVVGLGPLGKLIAMIGEAAGYEVIGCDIDRNRVDQLLEHRILATTSIEEMHTQLQVMTDGNGADAVFLCLGGKQSPLTAHSLEWIRDRGKIVIVGDVEPHFPRTLMFQKEAEILISRAGGPGRYDDTYEKKAIDYPYGYVRWTEGRNVKAYLRLVEKGKLNMSSFTKEIRAFHDVQATFQDVFQASDVLTYIIDYTK